ncbi:MAG: hypothetical protein HQM08_07680 [Candidatus Riflebacteria bacterium]|nr:hypothetical protein [Candidatus Riflebacteria bacterium]
MLVHHDVEADLGYSRSWHGFVPGRRVGALRPGFRRLEMRGRPYFYDDGIYYEQFGNDYQEIYPPVGIYIPQLPDGATEVIVGNTVYYYVGGTFYLPTDEGFTIVAPPMGANVPELPPGSVKSSINGLLAYLFNGIYYRPTFVHGVTHYMTFRH